MEKITKKHIGKKVKIIKVIGLPDPRFHIYEGTIKSVVGKYFRIVKGDMKADLLLDFWRVE